MKSRYGSRSRSGYPVGLRSQEMDGAVNNLMKIHMHDKNRGGRPRKGAAEKLKYKVSFFLSTGDYLKLKADAKATKLPRAEIVRRAVMGRRIVSRFTPEQAGWMRNLIGMGNNLNQLTKLAHQAGYPEIADQNRQVVGEISQTLKLFRDDGKDS
jgi:hypothetical protein